METVFMKRFIRVISLLLILVMLVGLIPVATSAASVLDGKKILFFGDSLTAFPKNSTDRYSDMVQTAFPNSTIINAGVGGDTTYLARLRFQTDVLDKKPDIVFICLGMNDAAKTVDGVNYKPIHKYRKNIQNFITALKEINCDVVLMTPNPVNGPRGDYSRGDHVQYCDVLRDLALTNNVGFLDMYTIYQENGYVSSSYIYDGIHQNAAGRKIFADKIGDYLNAVYNNQNKAILTVECVDESGKKIKSCASVGANGANIRLAAPTIAGYTVITTPITTTVSNKTITFTYRDELAAALTKAKAINRSDYATHVLKAIDYYVSVGEAEANPSNAVETINRLNYLLTVTGGKELNHSSYLKYTTDPAPNYYMWDNAAGAMSDVLNPVFIDDNIRLTDGSKCNGDGYNLNDLHYSVWQSTDVNVIFDFGRPVAIDTVCAFVADGLDSVSKPDGVSVLYSVDGVEYKKTTTPSTASVINDNDGWDTHCITLKTDVFVARYVKVVIDTVSYGARCTWVDEVEVILADTNANVTIPEPYNLSFDANGGTGTIDDATTDILGRYTLPECAFTAPEGKQFKAWAVNEEEYAAGDVITVSENTTVTAVWEDIPNPDPNPEPVNGIKGDVNMNGKIDARDYLLLKRAFFKTFTLQCADEIADINDNGKLDARDYLLLKRAFFKTYTIK